MSGTVETKLLQKLGTTPFPNVLLDDLMPTLKDTEWRLLCVIVRQTLGWQRQEQTQNSGARRQFDWLTHRQLRNRTGRASEAVCKALDSLVRKGLIEVWDENDQPLLTPQARRRYGGRMLFRLGFSARSAGKSEMAVSKTEIRKPKTTKETSTKLLPKGSESPGSEPKKPRPKSPESNPSVRSFLLAYRERFKARTAHGEPPVIDWGKDGRMVKQLLRSYSYERLITMLDEFFVIDDDWTRRTGYSLSAFKHSIGSLLIRERTEMRKFNQAVVVRNGQWSKVGSLLKPPLNANESQRAREDS
jgi:hypothetical protein